MISAVFLPRYTFVHWELVKRKYIYRPTMFGNSRL
jgi:hypothetical protein